MSSWKNWVVIASLGSVAACHGATPTDAGPGDTGVMDVGPRDTGPIDAGPPDLPASDVVTVDAVDGGSGETSLPDASDASADAPPDVPVVDVTFVDGGACGPLVDLNAGGTVTGTTTDYIGSTSGTPTAAPLAASCGAPDHEVILAYTVQATSTLSISLANPGTSLMFDTVLTVQSSCQSGSGTELACNDDTLPDRRSALSTGILTAGQVVYIVVGGSSTSGSRYVDSGTFELTVTENAIGGPCDPTVVPSTCGPGFECVGTVCRGYAESALTAPTWIDACTTGTHLMLTGRDDGHSPSLTIPFSFTFFGTAYTAASADTNGYVLLGNGTPSDSYGNSLPLSDGPLLAPFHDDLVVNDAPAGDICTLAVGTGTTQQFVIEWLGTTRYSHTTVNLNFEVVLNQTTNTVDYLYNLLNATGGDAMYADGSNAAIGVQAEDNNTVVRHTGTVMAGTGLRYTPVP